MALLKKTAPLPWENNQSPSDLLHPEFLSARLKRKARGLSDVHAKAKKSKQPHHKLSNRSKPVKNMWQRRSFFNYFDSVDNKGRDDLVKDLAFYGFPEHLQDPSIYYSSSTAKAGFIFVPFLYENSGSFSSVHSITDVPFCRFCQFRSITAYCFYFIRKKF